MLEAHKIGARSGHRWLWRGLNLHLAAGRITGVIGQNGAGKTTLLRCLAGLRSPCEGGVTRSSRIGYVAQSFSPTQPFTAIEIVAAGLAAQKGLWGRISRADLAMIRGALQACGAEHLADRAITTLSGGERKLVLIARALVSGTRLLILDEPMAALDLRHQALVLRLLRSLAADGCSIIWSAHDPNHLLVAADDVLLIAPDIPPVLAPAHEALSAPRMAHLFNLPFHRQDTMMGTHLIPDFR